jgi:antitoxin (DNA-binding transcriptional repressor) of toxin-antitoxin stability system
MDQHRRPPDLQGVARPVKRGLQEPWKSDYLIFMESSISATEAARTFSELLNRVRYRGDSFVVERGGEPICRMVPTTSATRTVRDLLRLLKQVPKPDKQYAEDVRGIIQHQPETPGGPWES